MSVGFLKRT